MICVNTAEIGPDGMILSGTEPAALLELDSTDGVPVKVLEDIHYELFATLAGQDLVVSGSAFTKIRTECARCLRKMDLKIGSGKICVYREKVPEQIVDVTDEVREDILLSLPNRFLCSPDCKGLCPGCGADLNTETCTCKKKKKKENPKDDHTWDALDGLKF